ncbi:MAG: response regulator transcription factor [Nakamurella sp.]
MKPLIRVLVADDQELLRSAVRMIVQSQDDMEIVGEAANGLAAVQLAASARPDVVVMDVRMPVLDGVEATRRIVTAGPTPKVLVLTTFDLDEHAFGALQAGASGFLLKDAPGERIVDAIRAVAAGDAVISPSTTRRLLDHVASRLAPTPASTDALGSLTDRERDVFRQLAAGASNAEIAGRLFLSETTVKTHVGHILSKLGLRDRVQAVVFAYESGIVRPGG